MSLPRALAAELTRQELAAYSDFDASDTFLSVLPDTPDAAVAVYTLTGTADLAPDSDSDTVSLRVVVRGAKDDVLTPEAKATAIYKALRDLGPTTWGDLADGGVRVARCTAEPPYDGGRDRLARQTFVIRASVRYHLG